MDPSRIRLEDDRYGLIGLTFRTQNRATYMGRDGTDHVWAVGIVVGDEDEIQTVEVDPHGAKSSRMLTPGELFEGLEILATPGRDAHIIVGTLTLLGMDLRTSNGETAHEFAELMRAAADDRDWRLPLHLIGQPRELQLSTQGREIMRQTAAEIEREGRSQTTLSAANRLELSAHALDTIRRRIARKSLQAYRMHGRWYVVLDNLARSTSADMNGSTPASVPSAEAVTEPPSPFEEAPIETGSEPTPTTQLSVEEPFAASEEGAPPQAETFEETTVEPLAAEAAENLGTEDESVATTQITVEEPFFGAEETGAPQPEAYEETLIVPPSAGLDEEFEGEMGPHETEPEVLEPGTEAITDGDLAAFVAERQHAAEEQNDQEAPSLETEPTESPVGSTIDESLESEFVAEQLAAQEALAQHTQFMPEERAVEEEQQVAEATDHVDQFISESVLEQFAVTQGDAEASEPEPELQGEASWTPSIGEAQEPATETPVDESPAQAETPEGMETAAGEAALETQQGAAPEEADSTRFEAAGTGIDTEPVESWSTGALDAQPVEPTAGEFETVEPEIVAETAPVEQQFTATEGLVPQAFPPEESVTISEGAEHEGEAQGFETPLAAEESEPLALPVIHELEGEAGPTEGLAAGETATAKAQATTEYAEEIESAGPEFGEGIESVEQTTAETFEATEVSAPSACEAEEVLEESIISESAAKAAAAEVSEAETAEASVAGAEEIERPPLAGEQGENVSFAAEEASSGGPEPEAPAGEAQPASRPSTGQFTEADIALLGHLRDEVAFLRQQNQEKDRQIVAWINGAQWLQPFVDQIRALEQQVQRLGESQSRRDNERINDLIAERDQLRQRLEKLEQEIESIRTAHNEADVKRRSWFRRMMGSS